jgi:hypothetical protein
MEVPEDDDDDDDRTSTVSWTMTHLGVARMAGGPASWLSDDEAVL